MTAFGKRLLGRKIGVFKTIISKLEAGTRLPEDERACALDKIFKVSLTSVKESEK